jgi:hypothetical protein
MTNGFDARYLLKNTHSQYNQTQNPTPKRQIHLTSRRKTLCKNTSYKLTKDTRNANNCCSGFNGEQTSKKLEPIPTITSYNAYVIKKQHFLKRLPGVGSEPGSSRLHLFSHFSPLYR